MRYSTKGRRNKPVFFSMGIDYDLPEFDVVRKGTQTHPQTHTYTNTHMHTLRTYVTAKEPQYIVEIEALLK